MKNNVNINTTGIVNIWGGRNSGKTYFAKNQIAPQLKSHRVVVIDPTSDGSNGHRNLSDFVAALYGGQRHLTLCNHDPSVALPAIALAWAHSSKQNPVYCICDEAPNYLGKPSKEISRVVLEGRHRGFGMAILGQRPSAVDANLRSQAETTFFFALRDHVDISVAKQSIGSETANKLSTFKQGEYHRHG